MKVGILGAGQLGRMMALAGIPMGINFIFYATEPSPSTSNLGETIVGNLDDFSALQDFADKVDVITYESENIPRETLVFLEELKAVYPPKDGLSHMQDRLSEKHLFNRLNIPTNDYFKVDSKSDLISLKDKGLLPLVLKKRRNGYDGKGQVVIQNECDLKQVSDDQCKDCIAESFVPYQREVSIIGVRSVSGECKFYDLCENTHKNGTLVYTENKGSDPALEQAKEHLANVMEELRYVGICTLEFFEVKNTLLANELAPRVHNSGHWTIEGCTTSQFENHLRAILNLPLGDVNSFGPFLMHNLMSEIPNKLKLLAKSGVKLHDYNKVPMYGRKLGHITVSQEVNQATAQDVKSMALD